MQRSKSVIIASQKSLWITWPLNDKVVVNVLSTFLQGLVGALCFHLVFSLPAFPLVLNGEPVWIELRSPISCTSNLFVCLRSFSDIPTVPITLLGWRHSAHVTFVSNLNKIIIKKEFQSFLLLIPKSLEPFFTFTIHQRLHSLRVLPDGESCSRSQLLCSTWNSDSGDPPARHMEVLPCSMWFRGES